MRKQSLTINSRYGTSRCLGDWEDTEFTVKIYAPFWLIRVITKTIEKCIKDN